MNLISSVYKPVSYKLWSKCRNYNWTWASYCLSLMLTFFLLSSLLQTCSLAWCFAEVYLNKRINISLTKLCCNNLQIFFYCANHKQATQPQRFTEQQRIAGWKCLALLEVFPLKVLALYCSLWEWQRLITFLH